jgi:hypothetical protein
MPGMPKPPSAGMNVKGTKGVGTAGIKKPKSAKPTMSVHVNTMRPGVGITMSGLSTAGMTKNELTFQKSELNNSCEHCDSPVGNCLCFRALSKPEIVKSTQGIITLKFKDDWDADALQALYRSIKSRRS